MTALPVGTRVSGHERGLLEEGFVTEVLSPTKVIVSFGFNDWWRVAYTYRPEHDMWVELGTHVIGVRVLKRIWVSSWQPRLDIQPIDQVQ